MKVDLNCVYETEKKTFQPGATPDLPKEDAERLIALGYATKHEKPAKPAGAGGEGAGDAGDGGSAGGSGAGTAGTD